MNNKIKIYAYYLPQFHETQENNIWWGKGFTEWDNVKKSFPSFKGHNQPRRPLNNNYYDLSLLDTLYWQANLAKEYGVQGFNIYHYWSEGVQLLSKPVQMILNEPSLDLEFNLTWANHPWVSSWKNNSGKEGTLLDQTYERTTNERNKHFTYLCKVMEDERYTTIDDKLLFSIYRAYDIPNLKIYLEDMREFILMELGKELHINAMIQYPPKDSSFVECIDTLSLFQPGTAMFNFNKLQSSKIDIGNIGTKIKESLINAPLPLKSILYRIADLFPKSIKFYDYDEIWEAVLSQSQEEEYFNKKIISGGFTDWDNTARYGSEATIFKGSSPEKFKSYMEKLYRIILDSDNPNIIFLNAWNEWGESAYLEPDDTNGYGFLEVIRDLNTSNAK